MAVVVLVLFYLVMLMIVQSCNVWQFKYSTYVFEFVQLTCTNVLTLTCANMLACYMT